MSLPIHWLLGGWYHRGLIVYQQRYRSCDNHKNVYIKFSAHDAFLKQPHQVRSKSKDLNKGNQWWWALIAYVVVNLTTMRSRQQNSFFRYARASSNYSDFLKRHLHLRNRLLDQGYKKIRLIRSLKKFIFRYQYLVEIYSVSAEKIISDAFSYSENV